MKLRRSHATWEVSFGNAVKIYDDGEVAAIAFLRLHSDPYHRALSGLYAEHRAPLADLEEALPRVERSVGKCTLDDGGARLVIEGAGGRIMGCEMNVRWGRTAAPFTQAARSTGHVWVGLVLEDIYQEAFHRDESGRIPPMRVLRLGAVCTG